MQGTTPDVFNTILNGIQSLLDSHLGTFVGMGENMFRGLATILIAWFGIQSALSSAQGGEGFNFARFSQLVLVIAFGFAMVNQYSRFVGLVTEESRVLSATMGSAQVQQIESAVSQVESGMAQPNSFDLHEVLTYTVIYVILATVQAVVFMVIGFGLMAQAVLILVGPIFAPFFVVPKLDWLFWGWFKAFLQYSFYQVIANAFVFIFAKLLLGFLALDMNGMTVSQWMTQFPALFIFLLIAIFGLLKIPTLTNHLFSGSAGADSGFAATMAARFLK